MRFAPSPAEQDALQEYAAQERFDYALTRILECEEVWSLGDDQGWLVRAREDTDVITIWPYRSMAQENARDELALCRPMSVSLEHFLYGLLQQCRDNGISLEVNPAPGQAGYQLTAAQLIQMFESVMEAESYFIEG